MCLTQFLGDDFAPLGTQATPEGYALVGVNGRIYLSRVRPILLELQRRAR